MPELYLPTKLDPQGSSDYVRVMLTWSEIQLLEKALHYYCFEARPGFRELTPGLGEHTYALLRYLLRYCDDTLQSDSHGGRSFSLFPVFFTLSSYRIITELLCLYVDPSLTRWQVQAKQSVEKKLETLKFEIAVVNAETAERSLV